MKRFLLGTPPKFINSLEYNLWVPSTLRKLPSQSFTSTNFCCKNQFCVLCGKKYWMKLKNHIFLTFSLAGEQCFENDKNTKKIYSQITCNKILPLQKPPWSEKSKFCKCKRPYLLQKRQYHFFKESFRSYKSFQAYRQTTHTGVDTAWKVSVLVFLVRIFQHSDWIRRHTLYPVSHRIQSECGKIRTRKILNTDSFHAVWCF